MIGNRESVLEPQNIPDPILARRRGVSIIWLIPLVAGAVALWLAYVTLKERGPTISITFQTAEGLEAGKTRILYKDVAIGIVDAIEITDGGGVVVTAEMTKDAEPYLSTGTDFWVVRPHIGIGGVSGLSTLVSGSYIELDPGEGAPEDTFVGLVEPPLIRHDAPGKRYVLRADDLGSVTRAAPVYFRGVEVGQVLGHELADDGRGIAIHIFIKAPHDRLVQDNSRFWNASGLDVSVSADGVEVATASLQAILAGGIAFESPLSGQAEPAKEETVFRLHRSAREIAAASYSEKLGYVVHFDGSVRGLHPGAPVEFRGMKVGAVTDVRLEYNTDTNDLRIPVTIGIEPGRVAVVGEATGGAADDRSLIEALVERGLRAQLATGSLLTGELLVALDFHAGSPPARVRLDGRLPELPSVPSDVEALTASAREVVQEIAALPLNEIGDGLLRTIESIEGLVSAPETRHMLTSLDQSTADLGTLMQTLNMGAGPLMTQARVALASANGIVSNDSEVRYDLTTLLRESAGAARSIRLLADYLERHPEALIRGKGSGR